MPPGVQRQGSAEGEFAFREGCEAQEVETWTATHRRSVHLLFPLRFRIHILLGETIAHLSPCCADTTQEMRRAVSGLSASRTMRCVCFRLSDVLASDRS